MGHKPRWYRRFRWNIAEGEGHKFAMSEIDKKWFAVITLCWRIHLPLCIRLVRKNHVPFLRIVWAPSPSVLYTHRGRMFFKFLVKFISSSLDSQLELVSAYRKVESFSRCGVDNPRPLLSRVLTRRTARRTVAPMTFFFIFVQPLLYHPSVVIPSRA